MRVSSWIQSRIIYDLDAYEDMNRFQDFMVLFEKLGLMRLESGCYYTDYNSLQIIFDEKEFDFCSLSSKA